jgi:site-specific recombinase XerD
LIAAARDIPAPTTGAPGDVERANLRRLRDVALLFALKTSGARVGELVKLTRGDLDAREKSAIVTGKGDKQRVVYFDDAAWSAIQAYLRERRDGKETRALYQLPLFAAHDRSASARLHTLSTQRVERIVTCCARRAGIETPLSPHSFRHAFATRVLEQTSDLAVVQDMLGHASPTTTRVYAKVSSRRMREAHRQTFGG